MPQKLLILLTILLSRSASADSASTANPLPKKDFLRILEERQVTLERENAAHLRAFIENIQNPDPAIKSLRSKLEAPKSVLTFKDLVPVLTREDARPLCSKLSKHDDAVLKFVANLPLAAAGDSGAAQSIHELLHNETLTLEEKRLLRTWGVGVGLRAETDDVDAILDHLKSAFQKDPKLRPGDTCPAFQSQTVTGESLTAERLLGKIVVVHFWATWCGPCMRRIEDDVKRLAKFPEKDVAVIFVSLDDDREKFDDAVKQHQLTLSNVFDGAGWGGTLARSFGVNHVPFDVVIDRQGKILSNSVDDVDAALEMK